MAEAARQAGEAAAGRFAERFKRQVRGDGRASPVRPRPRFGTSLGSEPPRRARGPDSD